MFIVTGAHGNLWFTELIVNAIGRITPQGAITEFPTSGNPSRITAGSDSNLRLVERHRVTHTQLVPTMFIPMLKLAEAERRRFDVSSLQVAIHAAAPCPIPVKEAMIGWWGPVLFEYYAGTEGNRFTAITSEEWLAHKRSVGRPILGEAHIVDDDGRELPTGEVRVSAVDRLRGRTAAAPDRQAVQAVPQGPLLERPHNAHRVAIAAGRGLRTEYTDASDTTAAVCYAALRDGGAAVCVVAPVAVRYQRV